MRKSMFFAVLSLVLPTSGAPTLAQTQPRRENELIGRWESQYSITGDRPKFVLRPDQVVIVFEGHKMSALNLMPVGPNGPVGKPEELSFSANDTVKTLDYWVDPAVQQLASYQIKGDELWLSIRDTGERCGREQRPRPTTFVPTADNCVVLLVLKKSKPKSL